MERDESGDALDPCPKCGTTSVNCPLTADQGLCPYDDLYAPEDDTARVEADALAAALTAILLHGEDERFPCHAVCDADCIDTMRNIAGSALAAADRSPDVSA